MRRTLPPAMRIAAGLAIILAGPELTGSAAAAPTIPDIQGAAHLSALVGNPVADVEGIVTAIVATGSARGFFMQDPRPGGDGDGATSDAIFVFFGSTPPGVAIGDRVAVGGMVAEFRGGCAACPPTNANHGNLTLTEIVGAAPGTRPTLRILSRGNALPPPVVIGMGGRVAPNRIAPDIGGSIEDRGYVFDPRANAIDFYESLEGMRVAVQDAQVVGPRNGFGEIALVADRGAGAPLPNARGGVTIGAGNFNGQRVIADDPLIGSAAMPRAKVGDRLDGVIGVMDYGFSAYRLLLTEAPILVPGHLAKEIAADAAPGQVSIASFNVENLAGNASAARYAALARQIVVNLKSPEIIGLSEIQDDDGARDEGIVGAGTTYARLIAAIAAAGGPVYAHRQIDPVDGAEGGAPGANIRVGFLFDPARVTFHDRAGGDATTPVGLDGAGALTFNPGRVDPAGPAWSSAPPRPGEVFGFEGSRPPLAAEFVVDARRLVLVLAHLKSKGSDQPLFGRFQTPAQHTLAQRKAQAAAIADFVARIQQADRDAHVIVLGDMNDFQFSETLEILEAAGLTNLYGSLEEAERYSYVFDGNSQALDHMLVSRLLAEIAEFDVVHVNSEFTAADRASDHDPLLLRLSLGALAAVPAPGSLGLLAVGVAILGRARRSERRGVLRDRGAIEKGDDDDDARLVLDLDDRRRRRVALQIGAQFDGEECEKRDSQHRGEHDRGPA
jgi:predicted extracellular nuclease